MEILYSSRGIYNFIDVDMGARRDIEENGLMYKVKMLEKNEIPYLVSPYENEVDGRFFLRYNTESNYVLERLMQKIKPDGNFLRLIFGQIVQSIKSSAGYLLDPNDIVIEPSYMFFNHTQKELRLICVPGYAKNINVQIKNLLEYFMTIFDHRDQTGVKYLYELYEEVTEENFSICEYSDSAMESDRIYMLPDAGVKKPDKKDEPDAESVMARVEYVGQPEKRPDIKRMSDCDDAPDDSSDEEFDKGYIGIIVVSSLAFVMGAKYVFGGRDIVWLAFCIMGFAITAVLIVSMLGKTREQQEIDDSMAEYMMNSGGDCAALQPVKVTASAEMQQKTQTVVQTVAKSVQKAYRLVPLNNGYLEPLNIKNGGQEISIGRGRKENDYRLSGSQISRIHARVYKRDENLYLRDAGSTNGTFVNSVRLTGEDEVKLNRGDVVAFATEEFFVS